MKIERECTECRKAWHPVSGQEQQEVCPACDSDGLGSVTEALGDRNFQARLKSGYKMMLESENEKEFYEPLVF